MTVVQPIDAFTRSFEGMLDESLNEKIPGKEMG